MTVVEKKRDGKTTEGGDVFQSAFLKVESVIDALKSKDTDLLFICSSAGPRTSCANLA